MRAICAKYVAVSQHSDSVMRAAWNAHSDKQSFEVLYVPSLLKIFNCCDTARMKCAEFVESLIFIAWLAQVILSQSSRLYLWDALTGAIQCVEMSHCHNSTDLAGESAVCLSNFSICDILTMFEWDASLSGPHWVEMSHVTIWQPWLVNMRCVSFICHSLTMCLSLSLVRWACCPPSVWLMLFW